LEKWFNSDLDSAEAANKIALNLGLIGDNRGNSLELTDPSDNTQPAPWARGLSFALLKAVKQLDENETPTTLMPWIFVPDGQAFHFIMVYKQTAMDKSKTSLFYYDPMNNLQPQAFQLLLPENFLYPSKITTIDLDALYVRHCRDENPKRKSQVNNLATFKKFNGNSLYSIWDELKRCPWLKNYVEFGKTALEQLLSEYEKQLKTAEMMKDENTENLKELGAWFQGQLGNVGE